MSAPAAASGSLGRLGAWFAVSVGAAGIIGGIAMAPAPTPRPLHLRGTVVADRLPETASVGVSLPDGRTATVHVDATPPPGVARAAIDARQPVLRAAAVRAVQQIAADGDLPGPGDLERAIVSRIDPRDIWALDPAPRIVVSDVVVR